MRFLLIFFCLFSKTFATVRFYETTQEIYQRNALIVQKYNARQQVTRRTVFTPVPTRPYARNQSFYAKDVCYDCQNAINTVQEEVKESEKDQNQSTQQEIIHKQETQQEKAGFTPEFLVTNLKMQYLN